MFHSLRNFLFKFNHAKPARKAGRESLRLAKNGDREQYLALAANYIDLAHDFFGTTVAETEDSRMSRIEQVFLHLWVQLRYTERLSDYEYMLATALIGNAPIDGQITSSEPLVTRMRLLSPEVRFAYIAYEFENWPLKWVALVMRQRYQATHHLLSKARCELCGISWESLCNEERACLQAISESFDKKPNVRANKRLKKRLKNDPRIATIKAQWLEMRPELVEIRLRYKPERQHRERILKNILEAINETPMTRPAIVDRMFNKVHFSRHSKMKAS